MTRDEARGQAALAKIDKYTSPKLYFVPREGNEKLYRAEEARSKAIAKCAEIWQQLLYDKELSGTDGYWTTAVPQVLHDTLENWDTAAAILACEAFLKRHGWKVERPALDPGLDD